MLVRMGRHERAIADLDRSIVLDPGRASAYLNRGAAYNALGQHERAITDLDEAIRRDPANAKSYTNRGLARLAIGQAEAAIADLSEAIRIDPKDATAHYQRAEVYSRLGLPSEAIADYDATIRLAPQFAPAFAGRGHALDALGRRDQAIAEYDMAIRLSPSVVGVYGDRGIARRARGDWPGAIADFSRIIELDPRRADAYAWRGWSRLVAAVDGADDDARSYLQLRRRDDSNAAYMAILGALASRRAGRGPEAEAFLDEAIVNISPRSWPAPVLRYLKHLITAEALLDSAADDRQMTEARAFLGLDLLDAGHRTAAVEHLRWVCEHGVDRIVAPDLAREALRRIEGGDSLPPAIP